MLHIDGRGRVQALTPPGIGLGLAGGEKFERELAELTLKLQHGDSLVLFTDGITESMNGKREEFGESGLIQAVSNNGLGSAVALCEGVFTALEAFVNGAPQHDDLTMVVVHHREKRSGRPT